LQRAIFVEDQIEGSTLKKKPGRPKKSSAEQITVPFLPQSLLRDLGRLSEETGRGRVEIIRAGMRLVANEHRAANNPALQGLTAAERQMLRELHRKVSRSYQATIPAAERKERGKRAAAGRWGKG